MRLLDRVLLALVLLVPPLQAQGTGQAAGRDRSTLEAVDPRQIPALGRTIALDLRKVSMNTALQTIARKANLQLTYSREILPDGRTVSLTADRIEVDEALRAVLQDAGLDILALSSGQVVVVRRGATAAAAQHGSVVGRVTDAKTGVGVQAAEVFLEGTRWRTATDSGGRYQLSKIEPGSYTLMVRRFGYAKQSRAVTVAAEREDTVHVALEPVATKLDELVTTATGVQRRMDLGNAITTLRADSILKSAPIKDLTDLLETRVPGMSVRHTTGAPGDPARIRLRGLGSIYRSNDPIVFVDGVRVYATQSEARSGNLTNAFVGSSAGETLAPAPAPSPLDQIDPNSIEKVEVFKGPSAATLYGADAANGVIVITTKRGRAGPTRWDASVTHGRSKTAGEYPTAYYRWGHSSLYEDAPSVPCAVTVEMCVQDSLVRYQALNDPEVTPFGGTGHRTALSLTTSGGSSALTYSLTGSYRDETGLLELPAFEVERFRTLFGKEPPDWMRRPHQYTTWSATSAMTARLGRSANVTLTTRLSRSEQQRSSLEGQASRLAGTYVDKVNGGYYVAQDVNSTVATGQFFVSENVFQGHDQKTTASTTDFKTQVTASWRPLSWLNASATGGLNVTPRDDQRLVPAGLRFGNLSDTTGEFARGTGRSVVSDVRLGGQVTAPLPWGFNFQVSVGADVTSTTTDDLTSSATGLLPGTNSLTGAKVITAKEFRRSTSSFGWYVEPQFQHARFTLSTGLRLDGGSTYGTRAKLTGMPKLSGSWLLSEEPFFPFRNLFTSLRLRAAYGRAGVQPGPADRLRLFSRQTGPLNGETEQFLTIFNLGNTTLRPERATELEGGFDADLLDGRLTVELTASRKTQNDALMPVPLPPSIGVVVGNPSIWKNIGVIRNTGLELSIGITPIRLSLLTWSAQFHGTWNRNKVVQLAPGLKPFYVGDLVRVVPGYPLGGRWARPIAGYADYNGDGVIRGSEIHLGDSLVYMGSLMPDHSSAFSTDLSLFNGAVGVAANFSYEGGATQVDRGSPWVLSRALADTTAPVGQQAAVLASEAYSDVDRTEYGLMYALSTFRFQSLSVSYRAPARVARLLGAQRLSLALQGNNLGLRSTYNGRDPSVSAWAPGEAVFDSGQLAQPRDWQLRLDLSY